MVLVTGPTGSGKTTTLYAALNEIKSEEDKIITIEDPVEYQIRGITQIPVNEKKGLTFARGLRSILRHDPDKILVGEIRDAETAQIAINSALTGHLVFTTVHANNVVDVLGRFLNMGVEPYNFVSALNCILAQRLVRQVCDFCARDRSTTRSRAHRERPRPRRVARLPLPRGRRLHRVRRHRLPRPLRHPRAARPRPIEIREMHSGKENPPPRVRKTRQSDEGMSFLRESAIDRVKRRLYLAARDQQGHLHRAGPLNDSLRYASNAFSLSGSDDIERTDVYPCGCLAAGEHEVVASPKRHPTEPFARWSKWNTPLCGGWLVFTCIHDNLPRHRPEPAL